MPVGPTSTIIKKCIPNKQQIAIFLVLFISKQMPKDISKNGTIYPKRITDIFCVMECGR